MRVTIHLAVAEYLGWTGILSRVYSCWVLSVPGIYFGSTATLTRIKYWVIMNE